MATKGKPKPKPRPRGAGAYRGIADAGFRKFQSRDALGMYIDNPGAYMGTTSIGGGSSSKVDSALSVAGQVIYYTDAFVCIHDKFPKASVHCLLLPRDPALCKQHPVVLLSRRDEAADAFLQAVRAEADKLRTIVAAELRRQFGQFSSADAAREAVLRGEVDMDAGGDAAAAAGQATLPAGRDWAKDVIVGVHARPSMNHLHVHILSRDMHSEKMRHRKHYNSFTTPFLVPLDEFPLAANDPRQPYAVRAQSARGGDSLSSETADDTGGAADSGGDGEDAEGEDGKGDHHLNFLQSDMRCWRCGRNFGNRFQELKRHLDVEFEAWRRE